MDIGSKTGKDVYKRQGMGIAGQIVLILFAEQSMGLMYLGLILRGMGVACISATKFGMIADSIEYGEYKTGTRAEGFVYSAASLGVRVAVSYTHLPGKQETLQRPEMEKDRR